MPVKCAILAYAFRMRRLGKPISPEGTDGAALLLFVRRRILFGLFFA